MEFLTLKLNGIRMASLGNLQSRVSTLLDSVTGIKINISDSYDTLMKQNTGTSDTIINDQITTNIEQARMYDRLFQEKEAHFQATGGKERRQTLQEYVFVLFFSSYLLLSIGLSLYSLHSGKEPFTIFIIMILMLIPICGIMIKFL